MILELINGKALSFLWRNLYPFLQKFSFKQQFGFLFADLHVYSSMVVSNSFFFVRVSYINLICISFRRCFSIRLLLLVKLYDMSKSLVAIAGIAGWP